MPLTSPRLKPPTFCHLADERPVVGEAVGEMADIEGVEVGVVVLLQHVEILGDDEGRAEAAGRHQQEAQPLALDRQRPAVGQRHAEARPFGHRLALLGPFQRARHARRHLGLDAPAALAVPAFRLQVVGHRGEAVGHRAPDVALAVAVEIDGVFAEERGQELRLAERARPMRSACVRARCRRSRRSAGPRSVPAGRGPCGSP